MNKRAVILVVIILLVSIVLPVYFAGASGYIPGSEDETTAPPASTPTPTRRPSTPTPTPSPTPTPTPTPMPTMLPPLMRPPVTQPPVKYSTIDDLPDLVPSAIGEARSPDRPPAEFRIEGAQAIPVYHYYTGENLVLISSVFNAGSADTGDGFFRGVWYLNDVYWEPQTVWISPPDAGQEITTLECWFSPPTPGEYKFTLVLDDGDRIRESNEENNSISAIFIVANAEELPDLIADFSISGTVLYGAFQPNQQIFITPNVTVNGILTADTYNERWIWGPETHEFDIPSPQANQVQIVRNLEAWSWTPTANGTYTIALVLDPYNKIQESNEYNNYAYITVEVDDFTGAVDVQIGN